MQRGIYSAHGAGGHHFCDCHGDRTGENLAAANKVVEHYEEVLAASMHVQAEISVKPTQLGLDIDEHATYANLQRLARAAEKANSFLWIDMEGSAYTDRTIALYRRLRAEAPRVALVEAEFHG